LRLIVRDLACERGGRRVFEGVSFALGPGGALIVTGRNGAGKSSLLGVLAGQVSASAGAVEHGWDEPKADDRPLAECLHAIGHRDALKGALTAEENLVFAQRLYGDDRLSPRDALAALGLAHAAGLPVGYLSAGQRRRVAFARLLVSYRPVWLLDEPFAALDDAAQAVLHGLMEAHRDAGGLVVATTHGPLPLRDAQEIRIERPSARAGIYPREGIVE
jgi:heme exporter protein A